VLAVGWSKLVSRELTNGCTRDAASAFAKCGHGVAYVLGRYVPIVLQNDFVPLSAQDRFKIGANAQC
jgi:hypothetical protein